MFDGKLTWLSVVWLFCAVLAMADANSPYGLGQVGLVIWFVFGLGIIGFIGKVVIGVLGSVDRNL